MCKFVDKRLHHEGDAVAARSAHCASRHTGSHQRVVQRVVRNEAPGKFIGRNPGSGCEFLTFTEGNEMVTPGNQVAGSVEAGLERVITRWAVKIVAHVVFTRPQKFYGRAGHL